VAGATGSPTVPPERVTAAQQLVSQFVAGQFAEAEKSFDSTMQQQLPEAKLSATWQTLLTQVGAFKGQTGTRTTRVQGYDVVFVTCAFEKAAIDVRVVYNAGGQVSGLFFSPAAATPVPSSANPPAYATPSAFAEREVQVQSGDWRLPGTLSMPAGAGPFPGIVLVQGSGAQDKDETIGPNKPFRDLAWGLASHGIAVLRYDKRTHADPARAAAIPNVTVKEEVTDDALAALALLRGTPGIAAGRVFLLGHSLGGMLAPRLAVADGHLAGLVILAGSTQPLEDSIVLQYQYIAGLGGANGAGAQEQLGPIQTQVARVKDPNLSASTPAGDLPLNVPASYWLDLRAYHPAETAKGLAQPMLILQGQRDYQVTATDLAGWQTALAGRTDVTFKTYPTLTHLFMPGQATPGPSDYEVAGHVDFAVIGDIVAWIQQH
jgi:dienelactone hydrolase